jgi:hypothetical protein
VGANSLCRAEGYFGEFFRRMRAELGTAQAITARPISFSESSRQLWRGQANSKIQRLA